MTAALIDPRADGLWRDIAGHRFASLFSSPPWLEALARGYDLELRASARTRGNALDAAIPFCHVRDLRGERVVSVPFSDYADPLLDDAETWDELVAPLLALGAPVSLRCLLNDIPAEDPRFALAGEALWHGADLAADEDALWAGLAGPARQNVRKARRHGARVRAGRSLDDVRLFHRLHGHVRKTKYRLLAQPLAFFEALHGAFAAEDRITVLLAEAGGDPVAGILLLEWGDCLYYKFNASIDQALRPNDLLVWEAMRLGRHRGLARLDFGLSDPDQPGLIRFKRKFASAERTIRLLRWRPPGHADPRAEEATRLLGRITHLLTDPGVPDEITRTAGDDLYRLFC